MESTGSARLVGGNQVSLPLTTTTTHHRFAKVKRQGNFQPRNDVFAPQSCSLHANPHSVSPFVTRRKSQINSDCGVFKLEEEEDDSLP